MPTATYSPEDNKLRLYVLGRLDPDTYARVKSAGFAWAPRQELFVAPAWTPDREDLLLELAGSIDDEDTSLVERAEERADRFEDYGDRRQAEADRAHAAVEAIADAIPLGQPILVGHHSERRARKDAERIESGIRRAVNLWQTAKYWQDRAAGAVRHAKYKERPDVRARRIKGLEADLRKHQRARDESAKLLKLWSNPDRELTPERALAIANLDHIHACFSLAEYPRELPASQYEGSMSLWGALSDGIITAAQARDIAVPIHERRIAFNDRWIAHIANRLAYERAILGEAGGTVADRNRPAKGGAVRCWASPGHGQKGWSYIRRVNKVSVTIEDNWGNGGENFTRTIAFDKLQGVMSPEAVAAARAEGRLAETADGRGFFLADPAAAEARVREQAEARAEAAAEEAADAPFRRLAETLRAGVQPVVAPQLFPTPVALARRVVAMADVRPGMAVLEPSAGTGRLLEPLFAAEGIAWATAGGGRLVAVERNGTLANALARTYPTAAVRQADFLELRDLGSFERIIMNPPFEDGADIRHIEHALGFLKPGGRLVAICANGPRQQERLMPRALEWHYLPADAFRESGTSVNAAIAVFGL